MLKKIEINGRQVSFEKPQVMGIINLTPDSFYDGGRYAGTGDVLKDAEQKVRQGAAILDLGAMSTRPGAGELSAAEELRRLMPPLQALRKAFPQVMVSVDTYRSEVAEACFAEGADVINDISGGLLDGAMFATVARLGAPYILMHMQGRPQTMQLEPQYTDVVKEVKGFFEEQLNTLQALGARQIILDPGFGFGKDTAHNFELLKSLSKFVSMGFPVLAGISRKSMVNKVLRTLPENALNGTTVLHTIALLNGANLLRVHDVKEARQAIGLVDYYRHTA